MVPYLLLPLVIIYPFEKKPHLFYETSEFDDFQSVAALLRCAKCQKILLIIINVSID